MDETEDTVPVSETKVCAFCNKETALALFGVVLGLVFIAMSLDVLRRNRQLAKTGDDTDD